MENANIRHFAGLIRDLEAKINNLIARVIKIEKEMKKIPQSSPNEPSNMELFSGDDVDRRTSSVIQTATGGGLTANEIKALISQWLENGELPITKHDHTDDAKGGDAYANKGGALQ